MSCSPFDLRDYFLQELSSPQRLQVEAHVKTCDGCCLEMERLHLTGAALFSLRDEEIPQRIAFVSDKIFEPSPVRRWFTAFWGSTARLGFAAAAMLSVAITFSAWHRTPAPAPVPPVAAVTPAAPASLTPAEIDQRVQAAVTKAVADVEARYARQTELQVAALRREAEFNRQAIQMIAEGREMAQRRSNIYRALNMQTGPQEESPK
jgi:Putative zinc-finger